MSINDLVIRGSTSISLHERFTSLRKGAGLSSTQGQSNDDILTHSRNGYTEDESPGPALRGATGAPSYPSTVKMVSYNRGSSYQSGVGYRSARPPPLYERYNPEQVLWYI